jgi:hypothetical protein
LERICILEPYRKFGLGKIIIKALEEISEEQGASQVKLHGQTQAEGFYHKLGYRTSSNIFMEDGIPHFNVKRDNYYVMQGRVIPNIQTLLTVCLGALILYYFIPHTKKVIDHLLIQSSTPIYDKDKNHSI